MRLISAIMLCGLCGGCFASTFGVEKPAPLLDSEITLLQGLSPEQITAYMKARPMVKVAGAFADGFEKVSRRVDFSKTATGETVSVASDHDVNTEALKAAIAGVGDITAKVTDAAVKAAITKATAGLLPQIVGPPQ